MNPNFKLPLLWLNPIGDWYSQMPCTYDLIVFKYISFKFPLKLMHIYVRYMFYLNRFPISYYCLYWLSACGTGFAMSSICRLRTYMYGMLLLWYHFRKGKCGSTHRGWDMMTESLQTAFFKCIFMTINHCFDHDFVEICPYRCNFY